jgi:ammonia channel protein AmtB
VHGIPGIVGALAIGFAGSRSIDKTIANEGLFIGGGAYLLAVQLLALVMAMAVAAIASVVLVAVTARMHGVDPPSASGHGGHGHNDEDDNAPLLAISPTLNSMGRPELD